MNYLETYRKLLDKDGKLTETEVKYLTAFVEQYKLNKDYFTDKQWAYVFATTFHETAHTFKPVIEAFWLSENWRKNNLSYYPHYGRGYVQITWKTNYKKFSGIIGEDLVSNPNLTLNPEIAFKILIYGFKHGTFTGKKISDYINDNRTSYVYARYCINGKDKRDLIASYAKLFEQVIKEIE